MKTHLFILVSFLLIVLLKLIPNDKIVEVDGIEYRILGDDSLPNMFHFTLICSFSLFATTVLTLLQFKTTLSGQFTLKRRDIYLNDFFIRMAFWVLLLKVNFEYFALILASVTIYMLIQKWYVYNYHPDFLTIDQNAIYIKSIFGKRKRNFDNLRSVDYDVKHNMVILEFQEGLQNIELPLTDFDKRDIDKLIENIKCIKGPNFHLEDDYHKYLLSA